MALKTNSSFSDGFTQERVTNLKAFQDASIQNDAADNVLRAKTATITAKNQQLIAQNQGIVAETNLVKTAIEKQKQDRLNDPNSLESQKLQSDIDNVQAGTAAKTDNLRASQDAVVLSDIYNLTQGKSEYSNNDIQQFIAKVDTLSGGRFDPKSMVSQVGLELRKVMKLTCPLRF